MLLAADGAFVNDESGIGLRAFTDNCRYLGGIPDASALDFRGIQFHDSGVSTCANPGPSDNNGSSLCGTQSDISLQYSDTWYPSDWSQTRKLAINAIQSASVQTSLPPAVDNQHMNVLHSVNIPVQVVNESDIVYPIGSMSPEEFPACHSMGGFAHDFQFASPLTSQMIPISAGNRTHFPSFHVSYPYPMLPQPMYVLPWNNSIVLTQPLLPFLPHSTLVPNWFPVTSIKNSSPSSIVIHPSTHDAYSPITGTEKRDKTCRSASKGDVDDSNRSSKSTGALLNIDTISSKAVDKTRTPKGCSPQRRSETKKRTGFHNNILYKTELCHNFRATQTCPRGNACQYAHGCQELRNPRNHPLYKTTICQEYRTNGICARGADCLHLHPPEKNTVRSVPKSKKR